MDLLGQNIGPRAQRYHLCLSVPRLGCHDRQRRAPGIGEARAGTHAEGIIHRQHQQLLGRCARQMTSKIGLRECGGHQQQYRDPQQQQQPMIDAAAAGSAAHLWLKQHQRTELPRLARVALQQMQPHRHRNGQCTEQKSGCQPAHQSRPVRSRRYCSNAWSSG